MTASESTMPRTCPSVNTAAVDQSSFWSDSSLHWNAHRIGWVIAGGCTVVVSYYYVVHFRLLSIVQTVIISIISVLSHCRFVLLQWHLEMLLNSMSEITRIRSINDRCKQIAPSLVCLDNLSLLCRIRILYMPPVYSVISFLSYRFFRDYTYYSLIQVGM